MRCCDACGVSCSTQHRAMHGLVATILPPHQEQRFAGECSVSSSEQSSVPFVPETAFGIWFLRTHTWEHHVLRVAINDLKRLIDTPLPAAPVIVDAGCGQGISF